MPQTKIPPRFFTPVLIISALGYFVDAFDIVIFSLVRIPSLTELGFSGDLLVQKGIFLFNMQLGGMLVGGFFWGFLGDRHGRSSALIFSILCYSLANIANGFVDTIEAYAICRFISGIGLAGELGAAVTLIMEGLPTKKRGLGALVIIFIGSLGAVVASSLGGLVYWRHLYFIGGGMGLMLLLARSLVHESELFVKSKAQNVTRGNALAFFKNRRMFTQFLCCLFIGIPHYLFFVVMITLSPEIGKEMGLTISVPVLLMTYAIFLSCGDMSATLLSQYLNSRRKAVLIFLSIACVMLFAFYQVGHISTDIFYLIFALIGFFAGYSLMISMIAAESFGTNLRVTAASTVTNCVRASAIVMNLGVIYLRPEIGLIPAVQVVGIAAMCLALCAAYFLKETFHKDMNFFD